MDAYENGPKRKTKCSRRKTTKNRNELGERLNMPCGAWSSCKKLKNMQKKCLTYKKKRDVIRKKGEDTMMKLNANELAKIYNALKQQRNELKKNISGKGMHEKMEIIEEIKAHDKLMKKIYKELLEE